jgi:CDP-diacylglycerol--glycerol-3-phosphate 3-phosphatidyltransferase
MRDLLKTVPNQLTAARLILIPVMWVLAWLKLPIYIGIGTLASFVTDVLDGHIARKLNQVSESGSKFDSLADNLLLPSALAWLWLFRPEVYVENIPICILAVIIYFSYLLLGGIKFKRFANLHLYSSKAASVPMYLFMSHALIADHYSRILFYIAAAMFLVSSGESFLLLLVCNEVNEHMGSLFLVWQRRKRGLIVSSSEGTERHP